MNKKVAIFLLLTCCYMQTISQDTIKLKNGITIHGLITDVGNGEIKFRIDGGSVRLSEVISYNKSGQAVSVNTSSITQTITNNTPPQECEIKNVGDVIFENKTQNDAWIYIYAIGITPAGGGLSNPTNNPLVTQITVPANSSATAYDLTAGTHAINVLSGGIVSPGQIKIKKCQTIREPVRSQ